MERKRRQAQVGAGLTPKNSQKSAGRQKDELRILKEALRKRVSELTLLYQMGRDISENENWSDALDRFLMAFVKYMHAEGAALLLFSQKERVLTGRANYQVDSRIMDECCRILLYAWEKHPRSFEIHSLEGYTDSHPGTCLERPRPWKTTIIPLRHRNRSLGFLILDKKYESGNEFRMEFEFLNTIQITFTEHVANASYISELRSLSRFNQKVLDNVSSGVITTDLDGYVRFSNTRASVLCPQLRSAEKVHFNDIFSSDNYSEAFYKQIIDSHKDNHVLEVTGHDDLDRSFLARLSTNKMFDDSLNATVLVAIFEDLTEQKRLEAEIRKNDRLRTLGQLSAGVAHEIRNPLTGIATSVEVLEGKLKGDEERVKYIKAILDEINRLDGIIKNLLDYAKPARPRLRSCYIPDVAKRAMNLLSDHAKRRGIALKFINKLKEDRCKADADQITQVLLNVVLNALQACKRGDEIKLVLARDLASMNSPHIKIEVIDTGPGIPAEVRDNIFEPFVTTKTKGTGMGLAISQQIVEEHSGRIFYECLRKGSKFTILLPLGSVEEPLTFSSRRNGNVQNDSYHR